MLTEYCKRRGIKFKAEEKEKPDDIAEKFLEHLEKIGVKHAEEVELDFQDIQDISDEKGTFLLFQNSKHLYKNLPKGLHENMSPYDNALWALLEDSSLFDQTTTQHTIEYTTGWTTYRVKPFHGKILPAQVKKLEEKIKFHFQHEEHRGENCTAEHFVKDDYHCFVVYPEDYLNRDISYDDKKKLNKRSPRRPVFEIYILYFPELNRISIKSKKIRSNTTRLAILKTFTQTILGQELSEETRIRYNLTVLHKKLLKNDFELPFNPREGIKKMGVKKVRLKLLGEVSSSVEYILHNKGGSLYDISTLIAKNHIQLEKYQILEIEFVAHFEPELKRQRGIVTARLTEKTCNLGIKKFERILSHHLIKWGFDPAK
jgi:hypothetical protein